MKDLIFEIGTEELPAGFIGPASEQMEALFTEKAEALKIGFAAIRTFSTPRRLAIMVEKLDERQEDIREELLGPSRKAAYDEQGKPTKAAEGFARSKGVTVEDLSLVQTDKGAYLQLVREVPGRQTSELLPAMLQEIIAGLSFPKSMRWGANRLTFARPIQWLLALYGDEPVSFSHEGLVSGLQTRGHRFMAPDPVAIEGVKSYEQALESCFVIADYAKRKKQVLAEITQAVSQVEFPSAAEVSVDEALLDTVTNLVESPFGVCGTFDDKYLEVPDQVLITSMREHQKYFPVVDGSGSLLPGFVAVNNTRVADGDITRAGHERVLRARLEDAYFFFESDKKMRLADRFDQLDGIIFQAKLGSMKEKSERIVKLTRLLAEKLAPERVDQACRSALLCKADLTTDMVGEFPSLQGMMGAAYAAHDGEEEEVATGIQEHYMPLRSGADLPSSDVGAIVGLADRIDTIAGCFGIGQVPTGTTDPFGLRRLSLAVLHLLEERNYVISIPEVFQKALALYGSRVDGGSDTVDAILQFIKGRFVNDCSRRGLDGRAVEAVTSTVFVDIIDCLKRIEAFIELRQEETFTVLAGSFKRIRNILKDHQGTDIDAALFSEPAEEELYRVYRELEQESAKSLDAGDYAGFLKEMLKLKDPVDRFFDDVMVMVDDQAVRQNRLNLLSGINTLILKVGDISRMHVSG